MRSELERKQRKLLTSAVDDITSIPEDNLGSSIANQIAFYQGRGLSNEEIIKKMESYFTTRKLMKLNGTNKKMTAFLYRKVPIGKRKSAKLMEVVKVFVNADVKFTI